ncbi:uncharacterized protein LOC110107070 [Dendrobium catenatum]|uniref:uncharacterized protein LOC110107070 n=1 Tax=Dendrobium catenatum TaxID=906689 RepID=UPI0009F32D86|nr:uncharacterized protein LOC110107070 [Dendrobium catenatum]
MKQHLAKVKGNIAACKKVPYDVRFQMQENLKDISKRKQQVQEELESTRFPIDAEVDEGGDSSSQPKSQSSEAYILELAKGKRKLAEIDTFFAPRTKSGSPPSIKSVLASKEVVHHADLALARWFFYCCIPFNALNSPYAQKAVDAITAIGPGYKLPSYHNMRVNLLKDYKEECRLLIDCYRNTWKDTGCTLMADGWTDGRSRTLINFMIYCPRGVSFLKSVDALDIVKDATNLCSLFSEIVEWVGPENIVQLVTDNAANYKKADLGSMPLIEDLAKKASNVMIFAYNHVYVLAWLRKRQGWKEIVRPGATRFKDSQNLYGERAAAIILDLKFWNDCLIISKIAGPLIRLLRIMDSDEKPSLDYLYDGMYRARKAIKAMFRNVKRLYKPFTSIVKRRWDTQLRQGIHAAAYFLNPQFQYEKENYYQKTEVLQGLVELIGNKDVFHKPKLAMNEVGLFRDSLESFGKSIALTMAKEMQPDEWWKMFGSSALNLQKVAIRILSQTSSSSGELENEGDGDDFIDFNDLGAFVAADFSEAGHEDLNCEDSFHDAN